MEEVLKEATRLLQNGEPEEALLLLNQLSESTAESEQIKTVSKQALSEQYLWLLNDAVKNKQYDEFDKYLNRYLHLIGNNELIAKFVDMQDDIQKQRNSNNKQELDERKVPFQLLQKIKSNKRVFALTGGVVLFLIVILICLIGVEGEALSDVEKEGLKGNIKYIAEYSYSLELQDGIIVEEPMRVENERGVVDYTESYYDTKGMLEKKRSVWSIYMNTDAYVYNDGLLKEIKHSFNAGRHPETTRFIYNKKRQLIGKYDNGNGTVSEVSYLYDSKGNLSSDGEYNYIYDRKGRLKEKYSKNYQEIIFSYDKSGNKKEYLIDFSDPTGYYDDSYAEYNVTYDRKGRIIEKKKKDKTNDSFTIYSYTYEDDKKGNWIVKNTFVDGEASSRTRRNIKYYGDKDESSKTVIASLIERNYELGLPCRELLFIPEIQEFIESTRSKRFYDLAVEYTDEDVILHKDVNGRYYADAINHDNNSGIEISYGNILDINLFLIGEHMTTRGEFNILPWEKAYEENNYGSVDENSPVYFLIHPFLYYLEDGQAMIENIEIRIDKHGLRYICPSFSNYSQAVLRIEKSNGTQWRIPVNHSNEVVHIGWENDLIFELFEILSTEETTLCIDFKDVKGGKHTYSANFSSMKQLYLVVLEFMYDMGAIKNISHIDE